MIIQIGTEVDESRILWKHKESDEWKRADIDDLIRAYEDSERTGEWVRHKVKRLCAPDLWYPGIFAIDGTWNEEEGSWLEWRDGFCSECGEQDERHKRHKYCPNCGVKMDGGDDE